MTWNIAIHGDLLEQVFSDFIIQRLPNYEQIWKMFIGNKKFSTNNQISDLADIYNFPINLQEARRDFAEKHYSCLESIICLKIIVEKVKSEKLINYDNTDKYLEHINLFMAYNAHIGRITDLVENLAENKLLKVKLSRNFNEYYQRRNVILHGKKIPVIFDINKTDSVSIPRPKGEKEDPKKWNDTNNWIDLEDQEFTTVEDYLIETFNSIVTNFNALLGNIYSELKTSLNSKNSYLEEVTKSFITVSELKPSMLVNKNVIPPSGSSLL